jgi:hypothetical protein
MNEENNGEKFKNSIPNRHLHQIYFHGFGMGLGAKPYHKKSLVFSGWIHLIINSIQSKTLEIFGANF